MVSEFYAAGGTKAAIGLTPGTGGDLQVVIDGETVFDKKKDGGHPNLDRIREIKTIIHRKLKTLG